MTEPSPSPDRPAHGPKAFRDALAELVQIGLSVARMVGRVAEAEAALETSAAEGVTALATSLAEAIEADQAAAAAAEARHAIAARTEAVARAFARASRAIRLTILLAERLDRVWAQPCGGRAGADDRHAMARRQIARGVADAIARGVADAIARGVADAIARGVADANAREADSERAQLLAEALTERLDREREIGDRPAEDIIADICRDLGLDPARMTRHPALPDAAPLPVGGPGWPRHPPQRRPDG